MIRRPPRSTQGVSSAASDVYKRQHRTKRNFRVLLAASTRAFEYRFARFFVSFGRFSPPSQCWRLGGLLLMSLTSSVIVVVRKIPVVELFRFKAGIAYWRFPTYVRTEGYLHILRAFGTRSLILRFQSFFSGDANPPFQSCLLYTSPSPRDVEESRMPSSA